MNVDIVGYSLEWWITALIAVDVVVPVCLIGWGVLLFVRARRQVQKEEKA